MAATSNSADEGNGKSGNRLENLPSTPDQKPKCEHFDTIVRVRVGEGDAQEVFEIYKGLLKFYSGYFKAAVNNLDTGAFAQPELNTITLEDEEVEVFQMFKSWLCTREFGLDLSHDTVFFKLLKLWCFGDRRQIPMLQNQVLDCLRDCMAAQNQQPSNDYDYIYENSQQGSKLRKFMVYSHARRFGSADNSFATADIWPRECLADIGRELTSRPALFKSNRELASTDMCDFHVHEEGVRCNKHNK